MEIKEFEIKKLKRKIEELEKENRVIKEEGRRNEELIL